MCDRYPVRPSELVNRDRATVAPITFDCFMSLLCPSYSQGCLYKTGPPFGIHSDRLAAIKDLEVLLYIFKQPFNICESITDITAACY